MSNLFTLLLQHFVLTLNLNSAYVVRSNVFGMKLELDVTLELGNHCIDSRVCPCLRLSPDNLIVLS